jgi:heme A synthase
MSPAARIAAFGSAGLLVICGAVGAAVIPGEAGQIVGMVLIGMGLILATAFVFMEVGLSEDHEREREEREREEDQRDQEPGATLRRLKRPNLGRSTGHRRRLS